MLKAKGCRCKTCSQRRRPGLSVLKMHTQRLGGLSSSGIACQELVLVNSMVTHRSAYHNCTQKPSIKHHDLMKQLKPSKHEF